MHFYRSIRLLSLVGISLCVASQLFAYSATTQPQATTFNQLVAAKTRIEKDPSPHGGSRRTRTFSRSHQILIFQDMI
ncbi:MAG TPA: hypothetical protein V6D14_22990 [Coleofasciculaceae cyanobacterium]|jgi:hypothetical protein